MAVRDGRIVAIGSNDEIRKLKGSQHPSHRSWRTFVMPGFNDAHLHLPAAAAIARRRPGRHKVARRHAAAYRRARASDARQANGLRAAAGTTRSGPARSSRPARTSTPSPAIIPQSSFALTATSASPTRPHSRRPASFTKAPDPHGGKVDRDANGEPPASFAKPRRTPSCRRSTADAGDNVGAASSWPWPTLRAGESPPSRTTPTGKTSSSTKNSRSRAS